MLRSLFFKEWLKTRIAVCITLTASLALCAYLLLTARRVMTSHGMMPVWDMLLNRDTLLIEPLRFVPLVAGVVLGVVQILPEMTQKRLKLMLHLPVANWQSVGAMVLYGVTVMAALATADLAVCMGVMAAWLPAELLRHIFLTAAVWYLAGVLAYLFTVWICMEPTWKGRVAEMLFAGACLRGFYISAMPEAYNAFLPIMAVFTALCGMLPMMSVWRFKKGIGL